MLKEAMPSSVWLAFFFFSLPRRYCFFVFLFRSLRFYCMYVQGGSHSDKASDFVGGFQVTNQILSLRCLFFLFFFPRKLWRGQPQQPQAQ